MNYRHGYHAGNFADLAKHAALLAFLKRLREADEPICVIDTHAGAGVYDLSDARFARSREAEAGIKYLLGTDVPQSLKPLASYVWLKNRNEGFKDRLGLYPGSPLLITDHLREGDDYIGCELRDDDIRTLRQTVRERFGVRHADGYALAGEVKLSGKSLFLLIDPPFERSDDYDRIIGTLAKVLDDAPASKALVWLPLKDLETFDRFLRHTERALKSGDHAPDHASDHAPDILVCELRLRSLLNPMKMNGCALMAVNPPSGFEGDLASLAQDVVGVFGEAGALAKLWHL